MVSFKECPEDFEVNEVMELEKLKTGRYCYFLFTKKNWGSFEAFQQLAKATKLKPSLIGYAGLKDKHAVTHQYLSVPAPGGKRLMKVKIKDMILEFLGHGDERITLGSLQGNQFRIVVRGFDRQQTLHIKNVRNYFDTQRFGSKTIAVGRAIVHHDFARVCELLGLKVEGDPIRTLRTLERRPLRFYISSYQSWMWNTVVEQLSGDVDTVPILGYLTTFSDKRIGTLYKKLMKDEKIILDSFLLKPIPELSSEGSDRAMSFTVSDFSYQWERDEMHGDKYKCILKFFLPKGCYATLVVKQLFPGVKDKSL